MFLASAKPKLPTTTEKDHMFPANISLLQILRLESGGRWNRDFADKSQGVVSHLSKQLDGPDILLLPALFDIPAIGASGRTGALVPNMVDLVVSSTEMFVPRPFGPRMKAPDAVKVLKKVMKKSLHGNLTADFARKHGLETQTQWFMAIPGTTIDELSLSEIAECYPDTPDDFEQKLLEANRKHFDAARLLKKEGWHQLTIPEKSVDLFELYTTVLLTSLGVRVHWIDTWTYHFLSGELHNATNCIRRP
jgi:hypothetical protein